MWTFSRHCRFETIRALIGGGTAISLTLVASSALAQQTASEPAAAEPQSTSHNTGPSVEQRQSSTNQGEIVVTARKRSELLTKVPDAVTAFSSARIEQAGLTNLRQFSDLTPDLTVQVPSAAYPAIIVRGLAPAQGGEEPVAVVIDGVQVSHPAFINQDYGDIAQLEVLRGPQGSLYGRNAIGGAINITTRQPTNEFHGRLMASYATANTVRSIFDLSGPIVPDKVLFRVGGSYNRTDGQIRDLTNGKLADGGRHLFLHSRMLFNATDRLTIDLRGNYGNDHARVPNNEIVSRANFDNFDPGYLRSDPINDDRRKIYDVSAKITYSFDKAELTSITGYSHVDDTLAGDFDFFPQHFVVGSVNLKVKATTEEVRLSSTGNSRLRWLAGFFYQDRATDNFLNVYPDNGMGQPVPGIVILSSQDVGHSKSWGAFGSASYDIVKDLELTIGGRYDRDHRTSVDRAFPGSDVAATFSAFQPKIQLSYKPGTLNFYASFGKGFSSGGFNAFYAPGTRLYKSMTAENYEVGAKGEISGNLLRYGVSLFHTFYNNQQLFFVVANPPSQNITNIDRVRVNGVEAELYLIPVKRLELSAGLGWIESRILRFAADPSSVGNRSPQAPKYTFNATAQYSIPVSSDLSLRAYASYRRQGSIFWDPANTLRTGPKDFVNGRLFLDAGRWSAGVFVENLLKSQYPATVGSDAVGPDLSLRLPSSPRRLVGGEATFRF